MNIRIDHFFQWLSNFNEQYKNIIEKVPSPQQGNVMRYYAYFQNNIGTQDDYEWVNRAIAYSLRHKTDPAFKLLSNNEPTFSFFFAGLYNRLSQLGITLESLGTALTIINDGTTSQSQHSPSPS